MTDLVTPFRDWLRHTHKVYLLKGISTQGVDRHLTSYYNNRRGVEHSISDTSQRVCYTRATGHQSDTHLTRHAGIALSCMGGSLLVTHQNMVETLLFATRIVEKRIVDRHD